MLQRVSSSLKKEQLQGRCEFQTAGSDKKQRPVWKPLESSPDHTPGFNIGPGAFLPVLYCDPESQSRVLSPMKWGLMLSSKARDFSYFQDKPINTPIETLLRQRNLYCLVARGRRCAVAIDGYFAWQQPPRSSEARPYFYHVGKGRKSGVGESLMLVAGLYDLYTGAGHSDLHTFSLVTLPSADSDVAIDGRLPAILQSHEQLATWLHSADYSQAMSQLLPPSGLVARAVCRRVNNRRYNDAACLDARMD